MNALNVELALQVAQCHALKKVQQNMKLMKMYASNVVHVQQAALLELQS
jgi:hypothetical protein